MIDWPLSVLITLDHAQSYNKRVKTSNNGGPGKQQVYFVEFLGKSLLEALAPNLESLLYFQSKLLGFSNRASTRTRSTSRPSHRH
jgi:hypothetical protein